MISLGILFLVIGVVLVLLDAFVPTIPAQVGQVGWLLAVVGVVLVVVGLVVAEDVVEGALVGGGLAMAVGPPGGFRVPDDTGDYRPVLTVEPSLPERQPVLVAFILGAVPLIVAAGTALADVFTGVPDWVVPTLATIGTLTTGLAALWARVRVTPTSDPKLDDGTPLVPEPPR